MRFSVIMINRDEERYIGYAIQSLIDKVGEDIELIIVDNESHDNSLRVVKTFDFLNVKEYTIPKNDYTPGRALNIGIMESNNPYTIILSAHCEIKSFDVKSVTQKLDGDVVALWGKQLPIWDGKKISRRYMWSNFKDSSQLNYYCDLEDRYFFHNAFSVFKLGLIPIIFLFIILFSVRDTNLKFLFAFEVLMSCRPILPIQPVIAKLIFFITIQDL